eukprot:GGOE01056186.1.p1 GENE.GGOE01056186.1~~GGOE01056186.1.p1  ORF type:complete len:478 (-),score=85.42 GGOE01056186.1:141-1514(-)
MVYSFGKHSDWSNSNLSVRNELRHLTLQGRQTTSSSCPSNSKGHCNPPENYHTKYKNVASGQRNVDTDSCAFENQCKQNFNHVQVNSVDASDHMDAAHSLISELNLLYHHKHSNKKMLFQIQKDNQFVLLGDILFHILQFLTPKDLSTACRVCGRWREATLAVPLLDQRLQWWQGDTCTSLEISPQHPTGPPLSEPLSVHMFGLPPLPCDESLELQLPLRANLQRLKWQTPSLVQRNLIRSLMARRDVMTISQHLSGKTSGCMIALVAILQQEIASNRNHCRRKDVQKTQPFGLVVVPSRRAALQAAVYCRWLAQRSPIVTASCYSEAARAPQLRKLGQAVVDILVATPRRLRFLLQENIVSLDNVIFVLLDNLDELVEQALEATEFVVQALPQTRTSCVNSNQDLTATTHPKRIPVMNFLNASKFLRNEIVIFHEGFSPPPVPSNPRWMTVDEVYD